MEFNGSLGSYKLITTQDGSVTLHSQYFDENCHSTSGAWKETIHNYIQGTKVLQKLKDLSISKSNKPLTIFEVGFGLGTGLHCTLKEAIDNNLTHPITFISTEIDRDFALWSLKDSPLAKEFKLDQRELKKTKLSDDCEVFEISIEHVNLKLLIGDARQTILNFKDISSEQIDCIFQDAFSSGKNPTLWTLQWFNELYKNCATNAILSTYSAAVSVRKTLFLAGFSIEQAQGFGQKRSMTICQKLNQRDESTKLHQLLLRTKAKVLMDC